METVSSGRIPHSQGGALKEILLAKGEIIEVLQVFFRGQVERLSKPWRRRTASSSNCWRRKSWTF
jgi:hypothetical protein